MSIDLLSVPPPAAIAHFVQNFWAIENPADSDLTATVLPDGMVDLFLVKEAKEPFRILLKGVDIEPSEVVVAAKTKMFAISCKLPAVEYLFQTPIADIVNIVRVMPVNFWGFGPEDLDDFDRWCQKAGAAIAEATATTTITDNRKKELFELIYSSGGSLPVKELSEKVFWSARQINRYFNQQFGLSLKAYCGILRFRASFEHIKAGKLFPEENFFDQSHFIKEVKRLSGVLPKDLRQNKNGRFLQFSALPGE